MSQDRFDALAADWDDHPIPHAISGEVFSFLKRHRVLDAQTSALDYGCGTGLLALRIAEVAGRVTGLDDSGGMLKICEGKIEALGLKNVTLVRHQFPRDALPTEGHDLVTASMVLHHIPDVPGFLRACFELLPSGGACCFGDLDAEDGGFHPEGVEIEHKGFDREVLTGWLREAGFNAPTFEALYSLDKAGQTYTVFGVYAERP